MPTNEDRCHCTLKSFRQSFVPQSFGGSEIQASPSLGQSMKLALQLVKRRHTSEGTYLSRFWDDRRFGILQGSPFFEGRIA